MNCISYKKGYKYQLTETYRIKIDIKPLEHILTTYIDLSPEGWLVIRKGYAWDGCSGPTWDDDTNMRGGLIHDAFYQLIRQGYLGQVYRAVADKILKDICLEDCMCKARACYYYQSVRKFAKFAADPANKKKVIRAPKKCK